MQSTVLVGCGGYDHDHWHRFYPPDLPPERRLEAYAERLGTVLLEPAGPPSGDDVRRWIDSTPERFAFGFVAPPYVEGGDHAPLSALLDAVAPLEGRLGPIVHVVDVDAELHLTGVDEFLESLPDGFEHALEFRRIEWYSERTRAILERHDAALSIHDHTEAVAPWWVTSRTVVVRRYGALGRGHGRYTSDQVQSLAGRIREWGDLPGRRIAVYFENDQEGFAADHALLLRQKIAAT